MNTAASTQLKSAAVIERALITSQGADLNIDLPDERHARVEPPVATGAVPRIHTDSQVRELEVTNMRAALRACGGKLFGKGGAARLLGMKLTTLESRVKRLEMDLRWGRVSASVRDRR